MVETPGYRFVHLVYEDERIWICYAYSESLSRVILWKMAKESQWTMMENAKLAHEFDILSRLPMDGVLKPHTLLRQGNTMVLLFELMHGIALRQHLGRGPLELRDFVQLAERISALTAELHQHGLLHLNLRPDTILLVPETLKVYLTGFSESMPIHQAGHTAMLASYPPYMAPERTGWMNRQPDVRTDLYALGVTFYEMLGGRLPFEASEPLAWAHAHLVQQPLPLSALGVPQPLSGLVAKLLAKAPEERYQTAAGLRADLQRCLDQLERTGRLETFEFGMCDGAGPGADADADAANSRLAMNGLHAANDLYAASAAAHEAGRSDRADLADMKTADTADIADSVDEANTADTADMADTADIADAANTADTARPVASAVGAVAGEAGDVPMKIKAEPIRHRGIMPQAAVGYAQLLETAAALKASQIVASAASAADRQCSLMLLLLEQAGASQGCWLISRDGQYKVQMAAAWKDGQGWLYERKAIPLDLYEAASPELIAATAAGGSAICLGDAAGASTIAHTAYVQRTGLRSVACCPISNGNGAPGLIYMENRLLANVFSRERLAVLQMIGTQLAALGGQGPEGSERPYGPEGQEAEGAGNAPMLTTRELEVLQWMANGLTNADIAAQLMVSAETVKAHVRNIYGKLGVGKRIEAINAGRKHGWVR